MDREINLDSILALERQIEEQRDEGHEKTIIQLKRTRNSLLKISTLLPPEILGSIFRWNVIPDGDFDGLPCGSYNFLLVCHHWFEVALRTPELWSFWGNSPRDWEHRHARCRTAPLDLVLETGTPWHEPSNQLLDALRDRAAQDTIRRIHLRSAQAGLLESVLPAIVTQGDGIRSNSVESFKVVNYGSFVDISAFFSRYHLQKLRSLYLSGCRISSWGLLKSQTAALTTLTLTADNVSPVPTLPQLLSILSSSPLLQGFEFFHHRGSYIAGQDALTIHVQLRYLERLNLQAPFRLVFALLNRLELPDKMDTIILSLSECSSIDLSQTLGPYLGDRVRRRGRIPGGGIGLLAQQTQYDNSVFSLRVGDTRVGDDPTNVVWFVRISAGTSAKLEDEEAGRLFFDLIAHIIQWEQVTSLQTNLPILRREECVEMRNLTHLHLVKVDPSTWFTELVVRRPHASRELLPGLDHIEIAEPTLRGGDWSPLTNFLSHRAAVGKRISSLRMTGHPHMDEEVVASMECVVDVFENFFFFLNLHYYPATAT